MTEGIELEALRMYLGSGVSSSSRERGGRKFCEILRKVTNGAIVTEPAKCKHSTPWRKFLHLAHMQFPKVSACQCANLFHGLIGALYEVSRLFEKQFPLGGKYHAAPAALEQVHADFILQVLHLPAQPGFRHAQLSRGFGEAQRFTNGE
jgi:hypothetical protein